MVKVLKCFNFRSSHILENVTAEPVCLAFGPDFLFAGTNDCSVEVFSKCKNVTGKNEPSWSKYCSFKTGAHVSQIEYNLAGEYIATVERKTSRLSTVVSVKVYLNWTIAHHSDNYRTRVRVAGLGYRSSNVQTDKRLEVVDIPCERQATYLATCQETGNLGIVFDNLIMLYHLVEKTIPNSKTTFLDVIVFLQIKFHHLISRISLCEDYMACCSPGYVQVFQVHISNSSRATEIVNPDLMLSPGMNMERPPRRASSALSSLNMQPKSSFSALNVSKTKTRGLMRNEATFSAVGERSSATPSPAFNLPSAKITRSAIEDDADFVQWTFDSIATPMAPLASTIGRARSHDISVKSHDMASGSHDSKTLRLKSLENIGRVERPKASLPDVKDLRGGNHPSTGSTVLEELICQYLDKRDTRCLYVTFIPTHLVGRDMTSHMPVGSAGVPVHSGRRKSLVGISCFISGPSVGYMVSLLPRPWIISTYTYSAHAQQIEVNGRLVYVMLSSQLEIYTSHCHIAAVHNTEEFDDVNKTCPKPDVDICMVGVQQFFGPRLMASVTGHLALFNKMDESWNINVLAEPTSTDLYHDMVRFGEVYKDKAPHTYEHLLLEGHMLLKTNLIGQCISQSEVHASNDILRESTKLLGECCSLCTSNDWQLCVPYFMMSGLSLPDILKQLSTGNKQAAYGRGLVLYLKHVLFLEEDPLDITREEGDIIVQLCSDIMAESLADVILYSRLRDFCPHLAVKLLQQCSRHRGKLDKRSSTNECLALVSLNLQLCDPEHAHALLATIDKQDLIETCADNHQILHTGMSEFTPLAQLLRCNDSGLLINILVYLYEVGSLSMDLTLTLLQGKTGAPDLHKNTHVRAYLETLVSSESRIFCFDEAVANLSEMYIQRMIDWSPPSIRHITPSMKFRLPKGGHFGRRHGWLDILPPFAGSESITNTCHYVVPMHHNKRAGLQSQQLLQCQQTKDERCSCFLCNEDLLKLQSLMCYGQMCANSCKKMLHLLSEHKDSDKFTSIRILALTQCDMDAAIQLVASHHPNIAAQFAASVFTTNMWLTLLKFMMSRVESGHLQSTDQPLYIADQSSIDQLHKQFIDQSDKQTADELQREEDAQTDAQHDTALYSHCIQNVLKEMAQCLKTEEFLKSLPGHANFFYFLPYIRKCLDFNKSLLIKERFIELGEQMASL